jgi:hypothetical protein
MTHLMTASAENGQQVEKGCGEVVLAVAVHGSSFAGSSPRVTAIQRDRTGGARKGKREGKEGEIGLGKAVGKVKVTSISKGTQYRPKIVSWRREALDDCAALRGVRAGVILNEAIDRYTGGRKRGRGAHTGITQSTVTLLRHCVLDVTRFEGDLSKLVTAVAAIGVGGSLPAAEALDAVETLLRSMLSENAALRRDMFSALELLRSESGGRKRP